jgi:YVTN family beta-propeller protein
VKLGILLGVALVTAAARPAAADKSCRNPEATAQLRAGHAALLAHRNGDAIASLQKCVATDPRCLACYDDMGWAHWNRSEWDAAIGAWQAGLKVSPGWSKGKVNIGKTRSAAASAARLRAPIGTKSEPAGGPVELELVGLVQSYRPGGPARDVYDEDIYSPKSARFAAGGKKVYINSLEGFRTVVYEPGGLKKLGVIEHDFDAADAPLFHGQSTVFDYKNLNRPPDGKPNVFKGKPVESEISHGGRLLWVPYYRRSWDRGGISPSAVAIIDTATDRIVRVMPTGPIPKYVVASPDNTVVAVVHWGDNTVALIDTSSGDPARFTYLANVVVESRLPLEGIGDVNRDSVCGSCLRGAVFSPDGKTLIVARLGGGGLAGIDVPSRKYLGSVTGLPGGPRHLVLSADGTLYVSHNGPGKVTRAPLARVIETLRRASGRQTSMKGWESVAVGAGARTIELAPDGRYLYAAANKASNLVVVDTTTLKVVATAHVDAYPVGLAVSPDGSQVWVTSQGAGSAHSGNSVSIFKVTPRR